MSHTAQNTRPYNYVLKTCLLSWTFVTLWPFSKWSQRTVCYYNQRLCLSKLHSRKPPEGNEHTPDPHLPFTLQNTMSSPWPCREPLFGVGHRLRGLWGVHLGCGHGMWDSGCPPQAPGQPGPAGNSYSGTAPPSSLRSGRSSILKETEHRDGWHWQRLLSTHMLQKVEEKCLLREKNVCVCVLQNDPDSSEQLGRLFGRCC